LAAWSDRLAIAAHLRTVHAASFTSHVIRLMHIIRTGLGAVAPERILNYS
jgi:hypothetical protein